MSTAKSSLTTKNTPRLVRPSNLFGQPNDLNHSQKYTKTTIIKYNNRQNPFSTKNKNDFETLKHYLIQIGANENGKVKSMISNYVQSNKQNEHKGKNRTKSKHRKNSNKTLKHTRAQTSPLNKKHKPPFKKKHKST